MGKYVKNPVIIEAFEWTGCINQKEEPEWIVQEIITGNVEISTGHNGNPVMFIKTLEGVMIAEQGDFIIKGIEGEIYPCKPGIFKKTYSEVDR